MNTKKEVNAYQKYDDLFIEQDKEYDKNNRDRYKKKKDGSKPEREVPNHHQTNKQKYSFISSVFSLIVFGFVLNFLFVGRSTGGMLLTPVIIFVIVMFIISKVIKNK